MLSVDITKGMNYAYNAVSWLEGRIQLILFHVNQVRNVAIREISKVSEILHWDDMHAD